MPEKNEHAAALGRLGKGKPKHYSQEEKKRRYDRLLIMVAERERKRRERKAAEGLVVA
jgi:hypothetical protein